MSMSINPSSPYASNPTVDQCPKTTFEKNSDAYGPVAASAIGLGEAVANGSSATVSFSEKALGKMASSLHGAGDAVSHGIDTVEQGLKSVGHAIGDGVTEAENAVEHAYDEVKGAASSAYDAVSSAGSKLAGYAAIGVQAIKDVV